MTSHRSIHVSDADDADLHVLAACSKGQAEEATLEEDSASFQETALLDSSGRILRMA
jgi:hypothetical protein